MPSRQTAPQGAPAASRSAFWKSLLSREQRAIWLPLAALMILIAYFAIRQPAFISPLNITVMGAQAGPLLLISIGATFVVLMGSIDLSVAAVATLAAAVGAVLLQKMGVPPVLVFILTVVLGILCGLLNALLSTFMRVPSFIATLASGSIFTGVMLHVLDGAALLVDDDSFSIVANGQIIPRIPNVLLLSLLAWGVLCLVNSRTRFGRYIVAIGAGERVAQLSGIPVERYKTYAFVLSSSFAAIGGFFLLSRLGSATPSLGEGYLLDSIAAIVVGGTALTGGVGGVVRTALGVALITVLSNGLNVSDVSSFTQEIVKGVVIAVAVLTTIDRDSLQNIVK